MMPPPPGRFSTTICCPHNCVSACPISRCRTSGAEPAGRGTIILTGRVGKVCADAGRALAKPKPVAAIPARSARLVSIVVLPGEGMAAGLPHISTVWALRVVFQSIPRQSQSASVAARNNARPARALIDLRRFAIPHAPVVALLLLQGKQRRRLFGTFFEKG